MNNTTLPRHLRQKLERAVLDMDLRAINRILNTCADIEKMLLASAKSLQLDDQRRSIASNNVIHINPKLLRIAKNCSLSVILDSINEAQHSESYVTNLLEQYASDLYALAEEANILILSNMYNLHKPKVHEHMNQIFTAIAVDSNILDLMQLAYLRYQTLLNN